jgi:uncharacterized protein YqjF (DUF2071 family)
LVVSWMTASCNPAELPLKSGPQPTLFAMIGTLTQQHAHRPWPLPSTPWTMAQSWRDLLFAHWPIPAEAMRAFVPPALRLDTFDGQAWIGVVPFHMRNVRPRGLPAVPWLSHFAELNVRTYVTAADGSKPGVWFFSLDAANPMAVMLARRFFMLPYYDAAMATRTAGDAVYYTSRRTHAGAAPANFMARYRPTGPIYQATRGTLEHWLTERYALYTTDRQGRPIIGEIHHLPWPLQPAEAEFEINDVTGAAGLGLPDVPPLLHFVRRLDVLIWPIKHVKTRTP